MIDDGVNDTVSDGFRHYLLRLIDAVKAQLLLNISHGDLGITDVQLLQTELEHGVLQPHDQGVVLVLLEHFLVLCEDLLERFHVSGLHAVHNLEVRRERLLQERLGKDLPVGNFSHKELNNDLQLLDLDPESFRSDFWASSERLDETSLRLRVLKLHSLDSTKVVQVSRVLIVGHILRESCLDDELASLLIQVLRQVRSQNDVGDGGLANEVLSETSSLVGVEHEGSHLRQLTHLLVGHGDEVHGLGTEMVESSQVDVFEPGKDEVSELLRVLVVAIIDQLHQQKIVHEQLRLSMGHDLFSSWHRAMKKVL
jgi:hypothetical protein